MKRETFRLDEWTRRRIEADVRAGIFPNRSEAFRHILRAYYERPSFSEDVEIVQERRGAPTGGWPSESDDDGDQAEAVQEVESQ